MVLLTLGLVVSVVLYISSPGLFKPLKSFLVYFDNAPVLDSDVTRPAMNPPRSRDEFSWPGPTVDFAIRMATFWN